LLEASFRNLLFFDTILKPQHDGVPHIPLEGIMREVERENIAEGFVKLIENDQAAIRLNDISVNLENQTAILLITYADKRGADPVFANLEKGTLRSEPKLEGEGVAISAHIAFGLKRHPISGLYPAILEDIPGVGRTLLEPFIRSAFRNASSYTYKNKIGKDLKTWPSITILIKQSEELSKSLNTGGYLTSVEVTKYIAVAGFDTIEDITEKQTTTRINIEGRPKGERAKEILNNIKNLAKAKGYMDMRVKWVNSYKEAKQVNLGTARADAGDALYGRVERVNLDQPLPQCSETINQEMKNKMLAFLI
jgi:hypothetical protein